MGNTTSDQAMLPGVQEAVDKHEAEKARVKAEADAKYRNERIEELKKARKRPITRELAEKFFRQLSRKPSKEEVDQATVSSQITTDVDHDDLRVVVKLSDIEEQPEKLQKTFELPADDPVGWDEKYTEAADWAWTHYINHLEAIQ